MTQTHRMTLGGKDYEVPKLAIKQNRHVEPLAKKHQGYFARVTREGDVVFFPAPNEEEAGDFVRIVYHALTRALPKLTFEEFEEWPLTMTEIVLAVPVAFEASGLFRKQEGAPTGEAPAGER